MEIPADWKERNRRDVDLLLSNLKIASRRGASTQAYADELSSLRQDLESMRQTLLDEVRGVMEERRTRAEFSQKLTSERQGVEDRLAQAFDAVHKDMKEVLEQSRRGLERFEGQAAHLREGQARLAEDLESMRAELRRVRAASPAKPSEPRPPAELPADSSLEKIRDIRKQARTFIDELNGREAQRAEKPAAPAPAPAPVVSAPAPLPAPLPPSPIARPVERAPDAPVDAFAAMREFLDGR